MTGCDMLHYYYIFTFLSQFIGEFIMLNCVEFDSKCSNTFNFRGEDYRDKNYCPRRHCFATVGPTLWSSLHEQLRQPDISLGQFKPSLKTFMFG